jgi:hypothetical protein
MVRPGRERLKGIVEVDQCYLAIRDRRDTPVGKGTKRQTTKAVIVIAVEILKPKGFGRIRLQQIEAESTARIEPFVREVVEPAPCCVLTARPSIGRCGRTINMNALSSNP